MGSAVRSVTRLVTKPLQAIGILPKAPKMPAPPPAPKAPTTINAAPDIESAQMNVKKQYAAKQGRRSTIMTSPQGLQSEEEITKKKLLGTER